MTAESDLKRFVLAHGAVNNLFLDRFERGELSDDEFREFAVQFFAFVRHFPRILATLLANTPDDEAADELATILVSELGDGNPKRRHEYLYHNFLRSIGIDPREAARCDWLDSTTRYVDGLALLYGDDDYHVALGASYGLEHMAITMWDHLIPGIMAIKERGPAFARMDTLYWTFHRDLEEHHEDSMSRAVEGLSDEAFRSLELGCARALDLLEGFWMGLEVCHVA
jgi:pyrroloquinoline-quinone synthase